jgi:hypothetical protein
VIFRYFHGGKLSLSKNYLSQRFKLIGLVENAKGA